MSESKTGAPSGFLSGAATFDRYNDFALRVSFCEITESFGCSAQRVTSIDDGDDFSGCKQVSQES